MSKFKLALDAGHGLPTAGRRTMKEYDPLEWQEWELNDRICDYIAEEAAVYPDLETMRVDDDDGSEDRPMSQRVSTANEWGADLYLSIHHNAGIYGGRGGGVTAYSYREGTTGAAWRDAFYDRIIEKTGLKGNRATPKNSAAYYVLYATDMPAVLIEHGFMDSPSDIPEIISDEFAHQVAKAYVEVIAERAGLDRHEPEKAGSGYFRVQVGAFKKRENAEKVLAELNAAGFQDAYIKWGE